MSRCTRSAKVDPRCDSACDKANTPISLCGEMAGEPQLCKLLLGLGLRTFSMHPVELLRSSRRCCEPACRPQQGRGRLLKLPDAKRIRTGLEPSRVIAAQPAWPWAHGLNPSGAQGRQHCL